VITYHYSQVVLPTGSDGRPIFIAGLWYQPVVKIFLLTVRNTNRRWWIMLQHNKIHNFFKQSRMKTNFISKLQISRLCNWWFFYLKLFIVPEFCLKLFYFKIQLFWLIQITSDEKMIENKVKDLAMIYNFVGDNFFIRNHLGS